MNYLMLKIIIVSTFIIYFLIMAVFGNSIASPFAELKEDMNDKNIQEQEVGFGDSVQTSLTSKRAYGKIVRSGSDRINSNLYIFYIFKVPLIIDNLNLYKLHLFFVVQCSILFGLSYFYDL